VKASDEKSSGAHLGIAGRIAQSFIDSKLSLLIVIASLLLGVFAVVMLPREEEPQIKVPMVDVLVSMNAPRARWKSCSGKFPAWNTSIRLPARDNQRSSCGSRWGKTWKAAW
jgi:hypothetical protein